MNIQNQMDDDELNFETEWCLSGNQKKKTSKRKKMEKSYSKWKKEENRIYIRYLQDHFELFENEYLRRTSKIFKNLSMQVLTKDSQQCRTHHQKMIKKYKCISLIIQSFQHKFCSGSQKQRMTSPQINEIQNQQKVVICKISNQQQSTTMIEDDTLAANKKSFIPSFNFDVNDGEVFLWPMGNGFSIQDE